MMQVCEHQFMTAPLSIHQQQRSASIHGGGGTPTRNHETEFQFMTQSVKSFKNEELR